MSAVLLRFFLGPVMDRNGPRSLMLAGVFTFATAPLLLLLSPTYPMLIAARIYQSLGLAVYLPGISTLAAEMAPQGKIGTYLGATRIFINLGLLAGPSAALLTIDYHGYNSWFVISMITSVFSLGLLYALNTPDLSHRTGVTFSSLGQIKRVLADNRVYPVVAGIALYAFTYSAVVSFAAVHIDLFFPGSQSSLFFILLGLAGIAGCLGAGTISDRWGRSSTAWPLLVTVGAGLVSFSLIDYWPILVIFCALILGLGIQGSTLVFAAWLIDLSKPELRATTMSMQENIIDTVFALGAMAFGFAAQGPGLDRAFMVTGTVTVLLVLPLAILSRHIAANRS